MIYVIIIAYSEASDIGSLVDDYNQFLTLEHNVVVVDNKGDSEIKKYISEIGNTVYLSRGNLGFGSGINYALNSINLKPQDIVLVSNDDVAISKEALDNLIAGYFQKSKESLKVGPVMPIFIDRNGNKQHERYEELNANHDHVSSVKFGPAALWLLNFELIKNVGGFCPFFFMYGEDKEYVHRSRYLGYNPAVVLNSLVTHEFDYPPKSKSLRLEKEKNTISSHFLDLNADKLNPHWLAFKGMIYSLITLQPNRLLYGFLGYIKFLKNTGELNKVKQQYLNQRNFLFIGNP